MVGTRRTTLVLGATGELGAEVARRLVGLSGTLFVHGLAEEQTTALSAELAGQDDRCRVIPLAADFGSLRATRDLLSRGVRAAGQLDILVNAVDLAPPRARALTEDGNELTWQVNYLAPALIALDVMPLLRSSPVGRIVHIVRDQHRGGLVRVGESSPGRRYYPAWSYTESKLALLMLSQSMASRLHDSSCRSVAMRPTTTDNDTGAALLSRGLMVDAVLYACTSPAVPNGAYLHGLRIHQLPRAAAGLAAQQRMWRTTCRTLGLDVRTGAPIDGGPSEPRSPAGQSSDVASEGQQWPGRVSALRS